MMDGVVAAVPTPVDGALSPIEDVFIEHCQWALEYGCDGLNILGSTGEANSFDLQARRTVMDWAARALPKNRLMVGTGTPSLRETIALTELADDLGYGVALVLPPYYYKPAAKEGLIAWYFALHRALGARPIQIYFYNFPQMTGIVIPADVIAHLVSVAPERFSGIKDSSGDLDYCRSVVAINRSLRVFPSSETTLQDAVRDGYAGCISASVNITAPLAGEIWANRSSCSRRVCDEIDRRRALMTGPDLVARIKYLVGARTGNVDWRRVLPPFTPLEEEVGQALLQNLETG